MFPSFPVLPTVLKIQLVRKCQAIPYVRFRRTCRSVDQFCEKHRRSLGIYIYRRAPKIYLLNSMKNTHPFKDQTSPDDAGISEPWVVVDYGRNNGDSNLKMPLNLETLDLVTFAISGFNFPELAVLNFCADDDEEGSRAFSAAFDLFLQVVKGLKVGRIDFKSVSVDQFEALAGKRPLRGIRLLKSKKNVELVQNKLLNSLVSFSCTFDDNYFLENLSWSIFFGRKKFGIINWSGDSFNWMDLDYALQDYQANCQRKLQYSFLIYETLAFFDVDLTTVRGSIIPLDGIYLGQFQLKGIDNLSPNSNWVTKTDVWLVDYGDKENAYLVRVSRDQFSRSTFVCVYLGYMDLNDAFLDLMEYALHPGHVIDYSILYDRLTELETVNQKRDETIGFIESIVAFYGQV